jgi:transglutaminase-like putative cysteine protease
MKLGWLDRVSLSLLAGAVVGSFAFSRGATLAWALLLPIAAAVFFRFPRLPAPLVDGARSLAWVFVAVTFLFRWLVMVYPVLPSEVVTLVSLVLGYGLSLFATVFLLGGALWRPGSTLYPVIAGALVVASMNAEAALHSFLAVVGAAVFLHLWGGKVGPGLKPLFPAALIALGALLLASAIILLLPQAQGRVEAIILEVYVPRGGATSGLSPHARLGEMGHLKLSKRVVMRVWARRAQKLRGRVFTQFDGRAWSAGEVAAVPLTRLSEPLSGPPRSWLGAIAGEYFLLPRQESASDASGALETKIIATDWTGEIMVSPAGVLLVKTPLSRLAMDPGGVLLPPRTERARMYGILHDPAARVIPPVAEDEGRISACLQVPEDTDARLRDLAAKLAEGARTRSERVRRTVEFVGTECGYALDLGRFESGQPVAEFLFEKKRGYCEYFASAAALLLRIQGVPTRYVAGVNVLPTNKVGDHYVVRDSDAHAWIEAYLPENGWVEFDPTPAAEYDALHADLTGGLLNELIERIKAWWADLSAQIHDRDWRSLLSWAAPKLKSPATVVLLAIAILLFLRKKTWRKGRAAALTAETAAGDGVPRELVASVEKLDRAWARHGFPRPASSPPLEHLSRLPENKVPRELLDVGREVVDCFYRARFRGERIGSEELARVTASVRTLPPA